jgi:hypothetical protein
MTDLHVVGFRPDPSQFAWTFGGVKPVLSVRPGTVLEVWTRAAAVVEGRLYSACRPEQPVDLPSP